VRARKPLQLSSRRGITGVRGLMIAIIGLAFVGCEETQACFPLGSSCTDATGFSSFFAANVPCCEGTCQDQPPPPDTPNLIVKSCE